MTVNWREKRVGNLKPYFQKVTFIENERTPVFKTLFSKGKFHTEIPHVVYNDRLIRHCKWNGVE